MTDLTRKYFNKLNRLYIVKHFYQTNNDKEFNAKIIQIKKPHYQSVV